MIDMYEVLRKQTAKMAELLEKREEPKGPPSRKFPVCLELLQGSGLQAVLSTAIHYKWPGHKEIEDFVAVVRWGKQPASTEPMLFVRNALFWGDGVLYLTGALGAKDGVAMCRVVGNPGPGDLCRAGRKRSHDFSEMVVAGDEDLRRVADLLESAISEGRVFVD